MTLAHLRLCPSRKHIPVNKIWNRAEQVYAKVDDCSITSQRDYDNLKVSVGRFDSEARVQLIGASESVGLCTGGGFT